MTTEDASQQQPAEPIVDPSQAVSNPVTAAVPPADNATPPPSNTADPQTQQVPGPTGEGEDELGKTKGFQDYDARKRAFLSAPTVQTPAPAPQAPPAEAPPTAQPLNDEDEFPSAPVPGQKIPAIKIRPVTPVDVQAMAAFKAAQRAGDTRSFVEYVQAHYPATGQASASPAEGEPASGDANPAPAADATPQSVSDVDARLKQLKQDRYKAMEEFDFTKAAEIEEQEEALRASRETLLVQQQQTQSEAERVWQEKESAALQKAAAMFPQSVKAGDPLNAKASEIYESWRASNDPRASLPEGSFYAYVDAAAELGIQPAAAGQRPVSQTPSSPPPVNRPPASAIIAGGNATTTHFQPDNRSYAERKADFLKGEFGRRVA